MVNRWIPSSVATTCWSGNKGEWSEKWRQQSLLWPHSVRSGTRHLICKPGVIQLRNIRISASSLGFLSFPWQSFKWSSWRNGSRWTLVRKLCYQRYYYVLCSEIFVIRGRKKNDPKSSKKPKEWIIIIIIDSDTIWEGFSYYRYFQKPDNFIGRAFYVLKTTPIEGEERTLPLFSHSGKHQRGKVTLQLSIKGQREDVPIDVSIREHKLLHKLIVNYESQEVTTFWG